MSNFFSEAYFPARERFLEAAVACNARVDHLALQARGPEGQSLSIDIAWRGSIRPRQVIVHQSGLHGVEGFAGSAIQLSLLTEPPAIDQDTALVLVHIINPFGMAWLRRVNERNVDLNRNCLNDGETWQGTPQGYRMLDRLLNPPTPPGFDFFDLRAVSSILRHGFSALKQAVVAGQFDYPQGLFYGGARLQQGPSLYQAWLSEHLGTVRRILVIDVHTGLGRWAQETLFLQGSSSAADDQWLSQLLGRSLVRVQQDPTLGYEIRGGMSNLFSNLFKHAHGIYITQEFGTYPALKVIHALREENRWHFFGQGHPQHPIKQKLKRTMCPDSENWRRLILNQGITLVKKAIKLPPIKDRQTE
ncbi:MAG: DUF2817 domain-containing protein [Gammaproteobacteria bacterium]|nr:DUF2817 domain-containing protein [Gammaproteobacteria bacterium]